MDKRLKKQKKLFNKYFIDLNYTKAIAAMNLALEYHTGLRKDGSPEVGHQFDLNSYLMPLFENTEIHEQLIVVAFLHDLPEDYNFLFSEINYLFGSKIEYSTKMITKKKGFAKTTEDYQEYYAGMATDLISVIVKMSDRLHNLSSIIKAGESFSDKRKLEYIAEAREYLIPEAKKMRKNSIYSSKITMLIQIMKNYCDLIEEIVFAKKK